MVNPVLKNLLIVWYSLTITGSTKAFKNNQRTLLSFHI